MAQNLQIIVAAHRPYVTPTAALYQPVLVGAQGQPSYDWQRDDTGTNISDWNAGYSELTGLYWAWQNLPDVDLGLVHYRRYFAGRLPFIVNGRTYHVLSQAEAARLLQKVAVVLPKKRHYWLETLYQHYAHTMHVLPLTKLEQIIKTNYPDYYPEFAKLRRRRSAHMFNMMLMKRELLDQYCTWLFSVLRDLDTQVDASQYTPFHQRFDARLAELLLDVWLRTNHIKYREVPVVTLEKQHRWRRIVCFLRAKFKGIKYEQSF